MRIESNNQDEAQVVLSYDEVYLLIQCCAEIWARFDENDAASIIGSPRASIDAMAEALDALKWKMRP